MLKTGRRGREERPALSGPRIPEPNDTVRFPKGNYSAIRAKRQRADFLAVFPASHLDPGFQIPNLDEFIGPMAASRLPSLVMAMALIAPPCEPRIRGAFRLETDDDDLSLAIGDDHRVSLRQEGKKVDLQSGILEPL